MRAENYAELLTRMQKDVEAAVRAGMATKSDELSIKVKVNEAFMMKTMGNRSLCPNEFHISNAKVRSVTVGLSVQVTLIVPLD